MSYLLALECSTAEGSIALGEISKNKFKNLASKNWIQNSSIKADSNRHSDKLPLEIKNLLQETGRTLQDLNCLAVGVGPGRWTGVRTALNVIRSLAFGLNLPVCPVNSLRVSAKAHFSESFPIFVVSNAFKNQVYFAEFYSEAEDGNCRLLSFVDWKTYMNKLSENLNTKAICISDLEDFYHLPQSLKQAFIFKKHKPSAIDLAHIACQKKEDFINWKDLKVFYLRSPTD